MNDLDLLVEDPASILRQLETQFWPVEATTKALAHPRIRTALVDGSYCFKQEVRPLIDKIFKSHGETLCWNSFEGASWIDHFIFARAQGGVDQNPRLP